MVVTSIQARKFVAIERLIQLEDEELLLIIEQLLMPSAAGDWADSLSDEDKKAIQSGFDDLKNGRTETFDAFENRMKIALA